jgi:HSP20 family protein
MFARHFYSPVSDMERLQREMNRLLNSFSPSAVRTAAGYPAVNMWVNDEGALVTAELPGFKTDDMDISVIGDTLTISGEKGTEPLPEGASYHRQERGVGRFARTLQLPFTIDAEKIDATFDKGVLNIKMKRSESDRPRKIAVKAA